jgi:hypothetical protein
MQNLGETLFAALYDNEIGFLYAYSFEWRFVPLSANTCTAEWRLVALSGA